MKFNQKKFVLLALVGAIGLTVAGCGKSDSGADVGTTSSPAASSEGQKPTLRALQVWQKDDYNTYPVAKVLEEKTGYKVQYDMLPQDNALDKLNLLMASGDAYDVITTRGDSNNKALFSDYAKRGALVDLGPLIDKYGPNIKASLSPESIEAAKIDGKLYGIPTRAISIVSASLLVRQDWLDKLGLNVPTTTAEFENMLKAFKEKDPGGNGVNNIPFTIDGSYPFVDSISGAFGMPNGWNDVEGQLVPRVMDTGYKDYLAYMNGLFKTGLLDKEFPVNKDANAKEKFASGKAGVIPLNWSDIPGIMDALNKNNSDAKWTYIPALKGPSGKFGLSANDGFAGITYIPKAAKHPEDAIIWMNAKLDNDTFKLMTIGEENKHYTVKDGAYAPILPLFSDERNQAFNYLTGTDEKNYPIYWQARVRKDPRLFAGWEFLNAKLPTETRYLDPLGISPYLPEYSKNNQSLDSMVNDQTVKFIAGADLTKLDDFIAKYKAAGGDASIKEVNEWYAAKNK
ncbi:extracellular solute-binding protein [Cohnella nanjingensis]|uniref:Extracellular solute-binding protein n=1 Tax=Cohnella nanjingensis TaxID=1387779 RepID=A0A7X0VGT9_9BACL|nr:extracellular solute-binding protein [Cohnella nanjingensis]MBB6673450.1 extracellular solute-binding protein [Cohnella nanjingensis]